MTPNQNLETATAPVVVNATTVPVSGWIGGFETSNSAFAYPEPNLTSLDMLDNMDNIGKLQRQQKVIWPEFSWETEPGNPDSRCFQMFSPDISRIGYTNEGRVYSIICPQQGFASPSLGSINVEVTVSGQRGWVDEENQTLAADMTVEGTIWFSPSAKDNKLLKLVAKIFEKQGFTFPWNKANAIKVTTHKLDTPNQPIFPVRTGETELFETPDFAKHPEAWGIGNVEVEIGPLKKTGNDAVDDFNRIVMDAFNLASGNMLKDGNLLTWNVWFTAPELVDQEEWQNHADLWRESIDADHGSPTGPGREAKFFDGTTFKPGEEFLEHEFDKILSYVRSHHDSWWDRLLNFVGL